MVPCLCWAVFCLRSDAKYMLYKQKCWSRFEAEKKCVNKFQRCVWNRLMSREIKLFISQTIWKKQNAFPQQWNTTERLYLPPKGRRVSCENGNKAFLLIHKGAKRKRKHTYRWSRCPSKARCSPRQSQSKRWQCTLSEGSGLQARQSSLTRRPAAETLKDWLLYRCQQFHYDFQDLVQKCSN